MKIHTTNTKIDEEGKPWGHWGSCQYDPAAEVFYFLDSLPDEEALKLVGLDTLPEPETSWEGTDYSEDDDEEITTVFVSFPSFMDHARNSAYDLWSVCPTILDLDNGINTDLGINCYLIYKQGLLEGKDPAEVFGGFDT